MRLNTDFPGDQPWILHVLFPLLQLIALLPISKSKLSPTGHPWGYMCQEPVSDMDKKVPGTGGGFMLVNIDLLTKANLKSC